MKNVALLGAGGKMGLRLTANLKKSEYAVRHVEISERGCAALRERGVEPTPLADALESAEAVVLALPDNRIGQVVAEINHMIRPGTMLVMLDVAAVHAGVVAPRPDVTWFITHPCHPPVFSYESDPQAHRDFFGGEFARQHIVCCLAQGPEEHYAEGEKLARAIYQPVMNAHRCTVEQMAILEPVLSETILGACLTMLGEAVDEAVRRGVPRAAARDFLLGHMRVELAIVFQEKEGAVFSDGALKAIDRARAVLFQPAWKDVFEPEAIAESVRHITQSS